jgi:hypothetical protein
MKVNRQDVAFFIKNIRRNWPGETSDEQFVEHLCTYMEMNPSCVEMQGKAKRGRFSYHTVGYGVMSLFGEKYRMGRVEVFDSENSGGYQVHEGSYSLPFEAASQFEDFIESIETDLPINIEIGSHEWCEEECAKSLGFKDAEEMRNPEKVKEYRMKKNDEFAIKQGYKDWDDLKANSKWLNNGKDKT